MDPRFHQIIGIYTIGNTPHFIKKETGAAIVPVKTVQINQVDKISHPLICTSATPNMDISPSLLKDIQSKLDSSNAIWVMEKNGLPPC